MTNKKNILYIAGLHGNEPYPLLALAGSGIPVIAGNPKALAKNIRYIEQDLNSSFGLKKGGYEVRRAKELLKIIPMNSLTVDLHTTTAKTEPFAIIVDPKMISFAAISGLKHIVYMKFNIKNQHALINFRNGFSAEVGNHRDENSMKIALNVVKNVEKGKTYKNIHIFEVYGIIEKPGEYHNFSKHNDGFIPVLAGEASYNFYGLKAKNVTKDYQLK